MKTYANIFKALSDETRLQILALVLHAGEVCVCDVMQICDITQSKASRHLRYLLHTGLLSDRRDGTWMYYFISNNLSTEVAAVLTSNRPLIASLWTADMQKRLDEWNLHKTHLTCSNIQSKAHQRRMHNEIHKSPY